MLVEVECPERNDCQFKRIKMSVNVKKQKAVGANCVWTVNILRLGRAEEDAEVWSVTTESRSNVIIMKK